ncbi:NifB/NifX family molybdenum-iron cluster-binding protein [Cellulosilyticum ruminicola]|uniref:NifB/NifX family molybdenum-iron cluster-binding protein n=1 Tax=Cellulosilyticum ruminicola TaxID=425254 RepID=UPI0006CFB5F8|nr:NifB/NifX family molybdenum-iron cluster-binding protein [Cellulosilyticum ruminicola]
MVLAITSDGKSVSKEFAKTKAFEVFDIQGGRAGKRMLIDTSAGISENDLSYILQNEGVEILICGSITSEHQRELENYKIKVITGAKGMTKNILTAYIRSMKS